MAGSRGGAERGRRVRGEKQEREKRQLQTDGPTASRSGGDARDTQSSSTDWARVEREGPAPGEGGRGPGLISVWRGRWWLQGFAPLI